MAIRSRQSGTVERQNTEGEWVAVPYYVPLPGESAKDAAAELGLRVLGRRETGPVAAVIDDGLGGADCVRVSDGPLHYALRDKRTGKLRAERFALESDALSARQRVASRERCSNFEVELVAGEAQS